MQAIIEWFTEAGLGRVLATLGMAMVPVVELRGAIPFGVALGLSHWSAFLISVIGNIVPVPVIILFIRKIFAWMKKKSPRLADIAERFERKAHLQSDKVQKYKWFGLMIFVAIPLPGTGAWTGALIAALLDMRVKYALPSIALGVLIAGFLITGLTYGFTSIFV